MLPGGRAALTISCSSRAQRSSARPRARAGVIEAAAFTDKALANPEVARLFDALSPDVTRVLVAERGHRGDEPGTHAVGRRRHSHAPRRRTLEGVLANDRRPLVVVAVDVQDPGNVGAIVRAAEAAGATGVIAAGASADPFGWKALRGAMGSAFRLPVVAPARPWTRRCARAARAACTSSPRHSTAPRIDRVALDGPCAVLVGAEGTGLPQAAGRCCRRAARRSQCRRRSSR